MLESYIAEHIGDVRVLFVDDEVSILQSLRRGLLKEPYRKYFADSAKVGLEIMAQERIDVIVSDMKMPQVDGLQLLRQVKELYPQVVRLVLSGYGHFAQLVPCINSGEIYRYISKPIEIHEFKQTLKEAIDYQITHTKVEEVIHALAQARIELGQARTHIKELQAILPVCAYCKKVRDEKEYWHQVANYINDHAKSGAEYAICTDCSVRGAQLVIYDV